MVRQHPQMISEASHSYPHVPTAEREELIPVIVFHQHDRRRHVLCNHLSRSNRKEQLDNVCVPRLIKVG